MNDAIITESGGKRSGLVTRNFGLLVIFVCADLAVYCEEKFRQEFHTTQTSIQNTGQWM